MAKEETKKDTKKIKKKKIERLYDKKPLIEFVVAILSVPSILLLLILNFKNLTNSNSNNSKTTPTPTQSALAPGTRTNYYTRPVTRVPLETPIPNATQAPCIQGLGPVSIASPSEGETVITNPVEIDISYDDSTYCSAVWSYSVNGSDWSDYDNNSVALYNLPNGQITFQLRVKSLTTSDSTTLTRNFIYQGQANAPAPTASSSAQQ